MRLQRLQKCQFLLEYLSCRGPTEGAEQTGLVEDSVPYSLGIQLLCISSGVSIALRISETNPNRPFSTGAWKDTFGSESNFKLSCNDRDEDVGRMLALEHTCFINSLSLKCNAFLKALNQKLQPKAGG